MTYDPNPVSLTYSEEELRTIIEQYISAQDYEFSYKSICHYVLDKAKQEGKVPNAGCTQYSSSELNPFSGIVVSRLLWEMIWEKKIFVAFGANPYQGGYPEDVRLCKYETK